MCIKFIVTQAIEDDPKYWDGLSSALAVGWLEIVVCNEKHLNISVAGLSWSSPYLILCNCCF